MNQLVFDKKRLLKDIGEVKSESYILELGDLRYTHRRATIISGLSKIAPKLFDGFSYDTWDYEMYPYLGYDKFYQGFCAWTIAGSLNKKIINLNDYLILDKKYEFNEELI